ncbi:MAG: trigger factor [Alphaproteobacteria bacterium]|nr:trigger factor [Alphaproteobacteria bacterium]
MQVTAKAHKGLNYSYSVTVPAAQLETHMESELQSLGQKVKIPGFRPGKVPMNVLKQRYAKDVMGDVLQLAVNKATKEVVEKNKLRPALQPDIKITEFKEGGDLQFDIDVEVMPEVPEIKFEKFTVDQYNVEISEEEVMQSLTRLAETRKHLHIEEAGKAAAKGSVVKIDFLGKIDGVAFPGGAAQGHMLELGSNQFIPGFEDQLIGTKAGDKVDVKLSFPKDYHSKDLAGKPTVFEVTVHEVHRVHTPDVNDKLAEGFGFKTLAELTDAVKTQMAQEAGRAGREKSKKQLFDILDEKVDFEVPKKMLSSEFDSIWKQIEEAKKQGDKELEGKSDAELKKEYEKIAERRVRLGIILSEIGRINKLQITKEELSAAVMQHARQFPGQEDKVFEYYRSNPAALDDLKGPILEEKAVDFILEKVKRTEKKVTLDDLMGDESAEGEGAKSKKKKK